MLTGGHFDVVAHVPVLQEPALLDVPPDFRHACGNPSARSQSTVEHDVTRQDDILYLGVVAIASRSSSRSSARS
jgi:hypothetical protein